MPILRLACPRESRGGSDLDRTRKHVARLAADPVEYLIMQTSTRLSSSICLFPVLPLCSVFAAPPNPPAFPSLLAAASSSLGPRFSQPYPPFFRQHRISLLVSPSTFPHDTDVVFTQLPASSLLVPLERFPVTNTLCERYDPRRKDRGGGVNVAAMIFERGKKSEYIRSNVGNC